MYNYYSYGYPQHGFTDAAGAAGGFILGFLLIFYLLSFCFLVAVYILTALSTYTIAKRRGIHHPWLAWLPVGDMWILGCISDQYQLLAKGRTRNRRKVLLGLSIGLCAAVFLVIIDVIGLAVATVLEAEALLGVIMAILLLIYLALFVTAIVGAVFYYMALYDLFASCDVSNAVVFLVLSILVNVATPFFLFADRKKDRGMPAPVVESTAQPVEEPVEELPEVIQ